MTGPQVCAVQAGSLHPGGPLPPAPSPLVPRGEGENYVGLRLPDQLETTQAVAGQLAALETYGLDTSFYDDYVQRVMAVTAEDLRRVANQYVRPENAVVVIVGDRSVVEAGIRAANVGPVEIRDVTEFVRE